MSNKSDQIENFDFQLIIDFYKQLNRQGPGSTEITKKALSFIENLPDDAKIADIGCGTGAQTLTLAENTNSNITAIDLSSDFINILNNTIKQKNYQNRISTLVTSMDNLPFEENELDLIWAEGSIYNIGFEKGLNDWRKYIKQGGYIAVSEVSWFTTSRPDEIQNFWDLNYPEIDNISNKVKQMEKVGYAPIAHFILPEYCWLDNFYAPMPPAIESFLEQYQHSEAAKLFIEYQNNEIELYKRNKAYYGYVFYIGKKI